MAASELQTNTTPSLVTHVVLFKFKEGVSSSEKHLLASKFLYLQDECLQDGKPYIISVNAGSVNNKGPLTKGYHVGFVMTLPSVEARDYYANEDPVHDAYKKWVGESGIVEDVLDFDFAGEFNF